MSKEIQTNQGTVTNEEAEWQVGLSEKTQMTWQCILEDIQRVLNLPTPGMDRTAYQEGSPTTRAAKLAMIQQILSGPGGLERLKVATAVSLEETSQAGMLVEAYREILIALTPMMTTSRSSEVSGQTSSVEITLGAKSERRWSVKCYHNDIRIAHKDAVAIEQALAAEYKTSNVD